VVGSRSSRAWVSGLMTERCRWIRLVVLVVVVEAVVEAAVVEAAMEEAAMEGLVDHRQMDWYQGVRRVRNRENRVRKGA
jgi:hypothetical protein